MRLSSSPQVAMARGLVALLGEGAVQRASGARSRSTLRSWVSGERTARAGNEARLRQLSVVCELFGTGCVSNAQLCAWLDAPLDALEGDSPVDAIASGRGPRVVTQAREHVYAVQCRRARRA